MIVTSVRYSFSTTTTSTSSKDACPIGSDDSTKSKQVTNSRPKTWSVDSEEEPAPPNQRSVDEQSTPNKSLERNQVRMEASEEQTEPLNLSAESLPHSPDTCEPSYSNARGPARREEEIDEEDCTPFGGLSESVGGLFGAAQASRMPPLEHATGMVGTGLQEMADRARQAQRRMEDDYIRQEKERRDLEEKDRLLDEERRRYQEGKIHAINPLMEPRNLQVQLPEPPGPLKATTWRSGKSAVAAGKKGITVEKSVGKAHGRRDDSTTTHETRGDLNTYGQHRQRQQREYPAMHQEAQASWSSPTREKNASTTRTGGERNGGLHLKDLPRQSSLRVESERGSRNTREKSMVSKPFNFMSRPHLHPVQPEEMEGLDVEQCRKKEIDRLILEETHYFFSIVDLRDKLEKARDPETKEEFRLCLMHAKNELKKTQKKLKFIRDGEYDEIGSMHSTRIPVELKSGDSTLSTPVIPRGVNTSGRPVTVTSSPSRPRSYKTRRDEEVDALKNL